MEAIHLFLFAGLVWIIWRMFRKPRAPAQQLRPPAPPPPETAPSTRNDEDDRDSFEGMFWDAIEPTSISASLRIKYCDSRGTVSERDIDVRQFDRSSQRGLLLSHCRTRNATRSFRQDRIQGATDLETGELIPDVHQWLLARWQASPAGSIDAMTTAHMGMLLVLVYVSKADGRTTRKELDVIAAWVAATLGDPRISADDLTNLVKDMGAPSVHSFQRTVGKLREQPAELRAALVGHAEMIVKTQKTVSPIEAAAIDYLRDRLSPAAVAVADLKAFVPPAHLTPGG